MSPKETPKIKVVETQQPEGREDLSFSTKSHIWDTVWNVTRIVIGEWPQVDMNLLDLALTDFSWLKNIPPEEPAYKASPVFSDTLWLPTIIPELLEAQPTKETETQKTQISPELSWIIQELNEIKSLPEDDLELKLKNISLLLHKIHYNYDLWIYTQEKKLEFLLELKSFLKHFKNKQQIQTFKQKFNEHKYKLLIETEKKDLVALARELYWIYFVTKKKVQELKEQKKEEERIRLEQEILKKLQEEKDRQEKMLANMAEWELELKIDNETLKEQERLSELQKQSNLWNDTEAEIRAKQSEVRAKQAQKRAQRDWWNTNITKW